MADSFRIIALYDEGKRYFQIGRKIDNSNPLYTDNVEWSLDKTGKPVRLTEYGEAEKYCKQRNKKPKKRA